MEQQVAQAVQEAVVQVYLMFQGFQEQQILVVVEAVAVLQVQAHIQAEQVDQVSLLLATQQAHLLHQAVGI
jgi:sterol desaturase/sphingolipid hydroxylase (fatty acid hydroxylase superfamily)